MIPFSKNTYKTADSYLSIDEAVEIFNQDLFLNKTVIEDKTTEEFEKLLIGASFILDNLFRLRGEKYYKDQKLQFPRNFEKFELSLNVKKFICFVVQQIKEDPSVFSQNFKSNSEAQVQKEKLDVLETVYFENKNLEGLNWTSKMNQYAMMLMDSYFIGKRTTIELEKGF